MNIDDPTEHLTEAHKQVLLEVAAAGGDARFDVAQVQERKGRDDFVRLPSPCRNPDGDFVITVEVRVTRWDPGWGKVAEVAGQVRAAKVAADQEALRVRRDAVAAELAKLDAQLGQA